MKAADGFFWKADVLTVSGQLEGERLLRAFNIYTFGPTFRAENSEQRRVMRGVWMIDPRWLFGFAGGHGFGLRSSSRACEICFGTFALRILALFGKFVDKGLQERLKFVSSERLAGALYGSG